MSIKVFLAKEIITLDTNCPVATAVAVKDERVLHVGTFEEVKEALRDQEFEIDDRFGNDVIVPGFIEAHGHMLSDGALGQFVWTGFDDRVRPDGSLAKGCKSVQDVVERLRESVSEAEKPLVGFGFDPTFHDGRPLRREDLDQVSQSQGVFVVNASGHLAYANSAHMKNRGVTAATEAKGLIKDANGEPTGEFHETAMTLIFDEKDLAGENLEKTVRDGTALLRQAGVTTGSEMAFYAAGESFEKVSNLVNDSSCPVRITFSPFVNEMKAHLGIDGLLARLHELRDLSTERFTLGPVKFVADGSIQGFTGKLKWPGYCGGEDHGFLIMNEEAVVEQLTPIHRAGFQAAIHTNGDEASEVVIRSIERIVEAHPRPDHRHRLEHAQMVSRSMLKRMARIGIGANLFSNHVYYWGDTHRTKTMGPDKARRMDAAATALAEGVAISIHSDHPVTPVSPLFTMWCAVNRRTRSGFELGAGERLTPLQALTAMTLGSAFLMKRDDMLGSIEVGKWADFTVLAQNPLTVEPMKIKDIEVRCTVVGGVATS